MSAEYDMDPAEVERILAERAEARARAKELTKALQKVKVATKDEANHTLAVKVPKAWAEFLKEYAEEHDTKVARLHVGCLRSFLESKGFDGFEDTDEEE